MPIRWICESGRSSTVMPGMKAAEHECRRLVSRISGASRGPAPGDHCSTSIAAIAAGFVP